MSIEGRSTYLRRLRFIPELLSFLGLATMLSASPAGSIRGIVRDPMGLPISAARLSLAGTATPGRRTGASDTAGVFQFVDLRPGLWTIQIDAPGFRPVHLDVL